MPNPNWKYTGDDYFLLLSHTHVEDTKYPESSIHMEQEEEEAARKAEEEARLAAEARKKAKAAKKQKK